MSIAVGGDTSPNGAFAPRLICHWKLYLAGVAGTSITNENVATAPGATSPESGTDALPHVVFAAGPAEASA